MSAKIIPLARPSKLQRSRAPVCYDRKELSHILSVYGRMVSHGYWKDYAIDMLSHRAIFSVYRRASETPLYQIIKDPALRNRQGQYRVVAPGGLILKRGHDLPSVLKVFDRAKFRTF